MGSEHFTTILEGKSIHCLHFTDEDRASNNFPTGTYLVSGKAGL